MSITMDEPGAARRGELRKAFDEADRSDNGFFSGNSAFGKQFPRLIVAKLVIVLYACVVCSSIVEATSAPDGQACHAHGQAELLDRPIQDHAWLVQSRRKLQPRQLRV